jgi:hypothetical protein
MRLRTLRRPRPRRRIRPETWAALDASLKVARLDVDDECAKVQLEAQVRNLTPGTVGDAATLLDERGARDSYVGDRARRVLEAVALSRRVARIDERHIQLFSRQRELGRLPLVEGFNRLALLEPKLMLVRDSFVANQDPAHEKRSLCPRHVGRTRAIQKAIRTLVGPAAAGDDELLRSDLAIEVVQRYLYASLGDTSWGTLETPCFSTPTSVSSTDQRTGAA